MTLVHRPRSFWAVIVLLCGGCDALWIDDEELCLTPRPYYLDADNDGYGVEGELIWSCAPEGDHQATESALFDCDDDDPAWNVRCRWGEVKAGYSRTCARNTRGEITCWGDAGTGGLQPPADAGPFTSFAVGSYAVCGLDVEGRVTCWGSENSGMADTADVRVVSDAPKDAGYDAVTVGDDHACAILDGAVHCWGKPELFQLAPTDGPFIALTASAYLTAAIRADGSVAYWGVENPNGNGGAWVPTESASAGPIDQVALGSTMVCERDGDEGRCVFEFGEATRRFQAPGGEVTGGGSHYCTSQGAGEWACNFYGAGGIGWQDWSPPDPPLASLSAGYDYDCGLSPDGTIQCHGDPTYASATRVPQAFLSLAAGSTFTVAALDTGEIVGWGEGTGDWNGRDLTAIDARNQLLCGLTTYGDIVCWGDAVPLAAKGPFVGLGVTGHGVCGWDSGGRASCFGSSDTAVGWYENNTRFVGFDAGANMMCGLIEDGGVNCWNSFPQDNESDDTFVQLSAGWDQRCGVREDHTADCWGRWADVPGEEPGPDDRLLMVAIGRYHACGILDDGQSATDGPVQCWVFADDAPPTTDLPAASERFTLISAGADYTCALRTDGTPYCWGDSTVSPATPTTAVFDQLATAAGFACGLRVGESPVCWGEAPGLGVTHPTALAAGSRHGCATGDEGTACFGDDADGQATPPSRGPYAPLAAGAAHTCGLDRASAIVCWGDDAYGQSSPPSGRYAQLAAGARHTCALDRDGHATCWGDDGGGQVSIPEDAIDTSFVGITAAVAHTCALTEAGAARCWGTGADGEPFAAAEGVYTQIVSGGYHACGLQEDGAAACWGLDSFGQVSDVPAWTFVALTAGEEHTCGLKPDGLTVCWGRGTEGQADAPFPWDL